MTLFPNKFVEMSPLLSRQSRPLSLFEQADSSYETVEGVEKRERERKRGRSPLDLLHVIFNKIHLHFW